MNFKKLHYTAFIFMLALLFISCEKESIDLNSNQTKNNRQVSSLQAKAFTSSLSNHLFDNEEGGAKLKSASASENRSVGEMQYIISDKSDTVMYAVNFENAHGYMILSGDKGTFPIIAFVDSGSFDLKTIDANSPMAAWLNEKKSKISETIHEPIDTTNSNYHLWDGVANDSIEIGIEFVKTIPNSNLKAGTRRNSTNKATVYPLTGTQYNWGQGTGYNFNAPISGAYAGCPAVAVGLLCIHNWYPQQFGYMYMPDKLPADYNQQNAISQMFREIGNQIPSYSWSVKGSGANPNDILTGIKRLGYTNAVYTNYEFETAYSNLSKGNPVLLGAYQNQYNQGGHIWFCDGYYEMSWKVTKTTKFLGIKVKTETWYEFSDYIYMNWGWDSKANGWYECNNWTATTGTNLNYNKTMYINLYPVK